MTRRSFLVDEALGDYLLAHCASGDPLLARLAAETADLGAVAGMQIGADQGALLTLLTRLVGATQAIEVGTFTGYSALCVARGLVAGGTLLCCDVSPEWTAIAQRYWAEAGVADSITLRLGPAADTLAALPAEPVYDIAFLDADKGGYADYWQLLVPRMRRGGLLVADNTLWNGRVLDPTADDGDVTAIRAFNDLVAADDRVDSVLLALADGLTLARVR